MTAVAISLCSLALVMALRSIDKGLARIADALEKERKL